MDNGLLFQMSSHGDNCRVIGKCVCVDVFITLNIIANWRASMYFGNSYQHIDSLNFLSRWRKVLSS